MDNLLLSSKKKPVRWHQEPWLLLVFGGPIVVILACIYTMFLAYHGADKIIAPDYYKQGLAINKDIRRDGNAHLRRLAGELHLDATSGIVTLHVAGDGRLPSALGLVIAEAGDGADEKITRALLTRKEANVYRGEFAAPGSFKAGRRVLWHVKVEAADWRLTADWHDPAQSDLQLKAEQ